MTTVLLYALLFVGAVCLLFIGAIFATPIKKFGVSLVTDVKAEFAKETEALVAKYEADKATLEARLASAESTLTNVKNNAVSELSRMQAAVNAANARVDSVKSLFTPEAAAAISQAGPVPVVPPAITIVP